jgi:uncharacterized OsmC-like protein
MKKKSEVTNFELHLNADIAEKHPKRFTKIHIEFIFEGKMLESKDI